MPPKPSVQTQTALQASQKAPSDRQSTIEDATSPLSPISPWPPFPSPPRQRGTKRRQSSSGSALGIPLPRAQSAGRAAQAGVPESGSRGIRDDAFADKQLGEQEEEEEDEDGSLTADGAETLPSAPEVYGALAALLTYIAFAMYLVWAFAPEGWLDKWGWTWYPDREWAIIVPCYLMLIVLLAYFSYAALTAWNTPSFDSMSLITDKYANIPPHQPDTVPHYHKFAARNAIPEAVDLPIDLICRVLYPPRRRPQP